MFKTILMTAAALVATAAVVPAHAGTINGASLNGSTFNGASLNSGSINGASLNSATINGASLNSGSFNGIYSNGSFTNIRSHQGTSTGAAGFVIDSIELPARTR